MGCGWGCDMKEYAIDRLLGNIHEIRPLFCGF